MPIIDIHTHCAPRIAGDPFGVADMLRGTPVGKNTVTNFRGLPAVSHHDMYDFDLQQEVCAKAGVATTVASARAVSRRVIQNLLKKIRPTAEGSGPKAVGIIPAKRGSWKAARPAGPERS